jgi:hypothetical protein
VIRRTTVRARTQEKKQHDLFDACAFCSFNDVPRAFDVDAFVSLIADLAVDPGAVSDRFATGKQLR